MPIDLGPCDSVSGTLTLPPDAQVEFPNLCEDGERESEDGWSVWSVLGEVVEGDFAALLVQVAHGFDRQDALDRLERRAIATAARQPWLTHAEGIWIRLGHTVRVVRSVAARHDVELKKAFAFIRQTASYRSDRALNARAVTMERLIRFVEEDEDDAD